MHVRACVRIRVNGGIILGDVPVARTTAGIAIFSEVN